MLMEKINTDIKNAMKAKDRVVLDTLRGLKSVINNEQIAKKKEALEESEILKVIKSEVKKRKDAIEQYIQAKRDDLALADQNQVGILENYLPEQITGEKLEEKVAELLEKFEGDMSNFGMIMKELKGKLGDAVDGKELSEIIKKKIG